LSYLFFIRRLKNPLPSLLLPSSLVIILTVFSYLRIIGTEAALQLQTLILSLIHLPLFCWLLLWYQETTTAPIHSNRFAFLRLTLNYLVTAGILGATLALFSGLSFTLLQVIGINPNPELTRLFIPGSFGLIPLTALVISYHPFKIPSLQAIHSGIGSIIPIIFRLLLVFLIFFLTLYLFLIPSHFFAPFYEREILVIFNALTFIVLATLIGAIPLSIENISSTLQSWLHRGIIWLIIVTLIILIYALSALLFRLFSYGLTPNRVSILGWDLINLYLLSLSLFRLLRSPKNWVQVLQNQAALSLWPYLILTLIILLTSSFIPLYT